MTRDDFRGQAWLVDIVFTRCPGPCAEMTRRMADLQRSLPQDTAVQFVSLTADPGHDTPAIFKAWGERFGVQSGRWQLLGGTKRQIVEVAVQGLKLTTLDKEEAARTNPDDLFIHSTLFLLVDKRGRVRSTFESDDPAMKQKFFAALDAVLREK